LLLVAAFLPLCERSFEHCNNWLCTSPDLEAGFNYPIFKKIAGIPFLFLLLPAIDLFNGLTCCGAAACCLTKQWGVVY
jgi:hypothetical protein